MRSRHFRLGAALGLSPFLFAPAAAGREPGENGAFDPFWGLRPTIGPGLAPWRFATMPRTFYGKCPGFTREAGAPFPENAGSAGAGKAVKAWAMVMVNSPADRKDGYGCHDPNRHSTNAISHVTFKARSPGPNYAPALLTDVFMEAVTAQHYPRVGAYVFDPRTGLTAGLTDIFVNPSQPLPELWPLLAQAWRGLEFSSGVLPRELGIPQGVKICGEEGHPCPGHESQPRAF